ncbi:MAG: iron-sulfur cluster assembly accessory protein [Bacteroidota bacterium]
MAEVFTPSVGLTDRALAEIKAIRERDNIPAEKPLRIGVKGGGCSGLSYVLDFDEKGEFDSEFEIGGVQVIMDQRHALYVAGMEVDYEQGLNDRGFIFHNPNASETCGCGTSFSA